METAPDNPYGMTRYAFWSDLQGNAHLRAQLEELGISYRDIEIDYIAGMGGTASLVTTPAPIPASR
jgi:hypothetical protein